MIRLARYEDISFIQSYANIVLQEATVLDSMPKHNPVLPIMSNLLLQGQVYYLVFEEQNQVVAWILLGKGNDVLEQQPTGFLYELYVLKQYRNRGIAKMLIIEAVNQLRNQGYTVIKLNVFYKNSARHFYKRLGFEEEQVQMRWEEP